MQRIGCGLCAMRFDTVSVRDRKGRYGLAKPSSPMTTPRCATDLQAPRLSDADGVGDERWKTLLLPEHPGRRAREKRVHRHRRACGGPRPLRREHTPYP